MLAGKLATSTVGDLRESSESPSQREVSTVTLERHADELGVDAPLRDVTFVMQEFAWQWQLAREFDGRMLCVRIGEGDLAETVPLSLPLDWPFLRPLGPSFPRRRYFPFPPSYLFEAYSEFLNSRGENEDITTESADDVLKRVGSGLHRFLAYRIAGFRAWTSWMFGSEEQHRKSGRRGPGRRSPGGRIGRGGGPPPPQSSSPGGGLEVEFRCLTPGLTVEFSHAYFIHFLNFGAPSYPVRNTLLAGRYVFQGKGPTYPSGTPRSQIFRIPPDYIAETTYF